MKKQYDISALCAHLSPFSSCCVGQTVHKATASVRSGLGSLAGVVPQLPVGPRGQELLTVHLPHLNAITTGLGALVGGSRRRARR